MNITSAKFVKSIRGSDEILNDGKKQIAFIGRSNVGKSSVINSLVNRKDLVRSGSMPGRTKQLDFFLVNDEFYFVDLPGYGYAQLSEDERLKLKKMMLWYLFEDINPGKKIILIIDAEVGPKTSDIEFFDMIKQYNLDLIVVANKVDKIKQKELNKKINNIKEIFPNTEIIYYSAKTNKGREELWNEIIKKRS